MNFRWTGRIYSYLIGRDSGSTVRQVNTKVRADGLTALATDTVTTLAGGTTQSWTSFLRYDDMNASTGGLARGTSITAASGWNQVYSYTGSGTLAGYILNLETNADWQTRLVIDTQEIFGSNGILSTDLVNDSIYDADPSGKSIPELDQTLGIFSGAHDRQMWSGPLLIPIKFSASVKIFVRRATGAATKKFQAGLIIIQKDT
jgi:hypothetical protein